jgi:hypothetical protein
MELTNKSERPKRQTIPAQWTAAAAILAFAKLGSKATGNEPAEVGGVS